MDVWSLPPSAMDIFQIRKSFTDLRFLDILDITDLDIYLLGELLGNVSKLFLLHRIRRDLGEHNALVLLFVCPNKMMNIIEEAMDLYYRQIHEFQAGS